MQTGDGKLRELRPEALAAVKELYHLTNQYGGGLRDALIVEFPDWHPTIQQGFVREVVRPVLEHMAQLGYTDARNEDSAEYARLAVEATKHVNLPLV